MSTETGTWSERAASKWRALERMQAYQVLIALGGAIAAFVGIVAFGPSLVAERILGISLAKAVFLVLFGALGLIGYVVSKRNVRNGMIVAAIAGLALVAVAGTTVGLMTGALVLVGAIWGFVKSL
ncbi:MAG TPA: hypothetical protein VF992_05185 [Thermoplasmata archaeon]